MGTHLNRYNSWKSFPKNNLLIRYEDLSNNLKVFHENKHLNQIYGSKFDKKKIEKSIDRVKFDNLKKIEGKKAFLKTPKRILIKENIFRIGKVGQWKNVLENNLIQDIEKEFYKEMKENII